jgi:FixJ family two-component response regulator
VQKRAVCIIDDDASVRRALRRLLHAAGYHVLSCSSAEEFLSLDKLPRPICLLVDLRMPGMTGIDLQFALTSTGRELSVVMVSGHADAATIDRALAAGALSFLSKPVEELALLAAVERGIEADRRRLACANPLPARSKT